MAITRKLTAAGMLMGKLDHGADLLEALTAVAADNGVTLAAVNALGAVQKARIGFYNQQTREYQYEDLDTTLEIAALVGNISLRDGKPILHAHVALSDEKGNGFGGHLAPGTIVFACEYTMQVFDGKPLERGYDETTGLPHWEE